MNLREDLNMNIDEIVKLLNSISEEVLRLKDEKKIEESSKEIHEVLYRIAMRYPLRTHLLKQYDERIQKMYILSLMHFFDNSVSENLFWERRLLIYRIIAAVHTEFDIDEYVTQSMKIDLKFWDEFIEETDEATKISYIVDFLILLNLDTQNSKKDEYEKIGDVIQFFHISKEKLIHLVNISKTILQQDFGCFIELIDSDKDINYDSFLGYFEKNKYSSVITNIKDLWNATGEVLIANAYIGNEKEFLDFSSINATSVYFSKCTFSHIRGIVSESSMPITFEGCMFEGNLFNSIFDGNYSEFEKDYIFIRGQNLRFINTTLCDCKVSKNLIKVKDSVLNNCTVIGCEGVDMPCRYLLDLTSTNLEKCKFADCKMGTNRDYRSDTFGGIVLVNGGSVKDCTFEKCESYGNSGCGPFAMQVICACNAKISNCSFEQCYSSYSYTKRERSCIIGLKNAKEENNEFNHCSSYQKVGNI